MQRCYKKRGCSAWVLQLVKPELHKLFRSPQRIEMCRTNPKPLTNQEHELGHRTHRTIKGLMSNGWRTMKTGHQSRNCSNDKGIGLRPCFIRWTWNNVGSCVKS